MIAVVARAAADITDTKQFQNSYQHFSNTVL